jgi:hypothetical protein
MKFNLIPTVALLCSMTLPVFSASHCNKVYNTTRSGFTYRLPAYGSSTTTNCLLSLNAQGDDVKWLQYTLNNCYNPSTFLTLDGIYGPKTRDEVIAVQRHYGLAQDGVYGPDTRAAMIWDGQSADGSDVCRKVSWSELSGQHTVRYTAICSLFQSVSINGRRKMFGVMIDRCRNIVEII